ncbi:MAG: methyltransferase domain-containing protein [Deltaproteobacteria bacterium]|jgi:SAM-dependent methyltransferase|nr:methyltransferase domain-containing protein [Deltaproteobacteria bacterium]
MKQKTTGSYDFGTLKDNQTEMDRLAHQAHMAGFMDQTIWQLTGLQDGMEVMDLACGSGQVTRQMAEVCPTARILGVDASEDLLAEAARLQEASPFPNLTFCKGDVYDLSVLAQERFDYVYVRLLFQHMSQPRKALTSIRKSLKPGGILCVVDVDDDWLMLEPEPMSLRAFNLAAANGQANKGGDRHVGRHLPGYMHDVGFEQVRLDLMPLSSFHIGLKNFLDITTRFKLEQIPEEQQEQGRRQLEEIYAVLEEPFAWGMVGAFASSGRK